MPALLHDTSGVEHRVLTLDDLQAIVGKILWRCGAGAVAVLIASVALVKDIRHDIAKTQLDLQRIESEGSKPVRLLQASLAQVQTELAQTRELLQEVRDELRTRRP